RGQGIEVVPLAFADHHAYAAGDLDFGDQLPVLMTEKDAVKCRAFAQPHWFYVPVSVQIGTDDTEHVRKSCERLRR
ncbi:MAG: tetraacyldisaccharide 4'-kinase, partial [Stenotrophobium sp.]